MPPIDLSPEQEKTVREILGRHVPDRDVWVFGSRVSWTARPQSDLDLCVLGETALSLATKAALEEAFTESDLPFKVDIVDWATTNDRFRRIIEKQYVLLQKGKRSDATWLARDSTESRPTS